MRRAAFYLVAFVLGVQLAIAAGSIAGCLYLKDRRCTGEQVSELMLYITAQTFALYAAEK